VTVSQAEIERRHHAWWAVRRMLGRELTQAQLGEVLRRIEDPLRDFLDPPPEPPPVRLALDAMPDDKDLSAAAQLVIRLDHFMNGRYAAKTIREIAPVIRAVNSHIGQFVSDEEGAEIAVYTMCRESADADNYLVWEEEFRATHGGRYPTRNEAHDALKLPYVRIQEFFRIYHPNDVRQGGRPRRK
jgi:hypothetical protein